ncbi:heterokaryon incompatibility protein-domain-containing protein [Lasiosphaeris hirsuta]|uniref:Heterokaryon incompatibility protein-domain-containing protein n=1 Tax=Lasiosphaeris hirsuta TaxID=260670 RepID=A0AA40A9F4_9PEZI|nr:heterokaryon incompatibility protein-domain-containing protein [Lasiosphaeris hirsuta]
MASTTCVRLLGCGLWPQIPKTSLYVQVPFSDATSEIRLLTVQPAAKPAAPIRCQLSVVDLAHPGDYEGLSYHWGEVTDDYISVNGRKILVGGNLFNALKHLRYRDRPRVLWVDAICIDQESNDAGGEKCKQIPLMRRIYQQSTQTIAWFGLYHNVHILSRFVEKLLQSKRRLSHKLESGAYYPTPSDFEEYRIPSADHGGYRALADFLSTSWTERVWVIQEAAVARRVTIQCGDHAFPFKDIARAALFTFTLAIKDFNPGTQFKSTWAECTKQKLGQRGTLLSLVMRHWLSEASKYHHDKIYALCGLARDAGPDGLDIRFDYTKPWEEAYTDFARSVLATYGNLDIFSALTTMKRLSWELPTWTPDWRVASYKNNTLIYRRPEPPPEPGPIRVLFAAAKTSVSCPQFSPDGRRVRLSGFILDTIVAAGDIRPDKFTPLKIVRNLTHWRDYIAQCETKEHYQHTGQPMTDAFYETITMNNARGFLQDPPSDYSTFNRHLNALKVKSECCQDITEGGSNPTWEAFVRSTVISASGASVNRRLVRTRNGYLGLVPEESGVLGHIALFEGGALPIVIRASTRVSGCWEVVGDAYVHGVMMGEAFDESRCSDFWFV